MTRIEFNHIVNLTIINDAEVVKVTVKDLTPPQLDDLLYVTNPDRIAEFKNLRFRKTVLEVLGRTPRHDMDQDPIGSESIEFDALGHLVCMEFQPFEVMEIQEIDRKQIWGFNSELIDVVCDLRIMGIVNMHRENDYKIKEVCLTKVGSALCDILFQI